jgi:crotonobetainyl-CoA:carnitine CoA-transferase CaiB-like acyl-CoA transferase
VTLTASEPGAPDNRQGPLTGYRVLELGTTVAGPFCARLMADFGADVVKVEPFEGDPIRSAGKHLDGKSLYAASILRNKRLISVDLRQASGRDIIKRLVPKFDVVVENFRPGALEKLGMGYDDLVKLRTDIIMVRISGFGQDGPYSPKPGYGVICEAVSGLRHITGDPDRPPARVAIALTDYITGLYAAYGAAMALVHRERTGEGQYIDAALAECAFSLMEPHVPAYDKLGAVANRTGSGLPGSVPNNLYPTSDGGYIHIQAAQQPVFKRFALAIGMEALLQDERYATAILRARHQAELDETVAQWTSRHSLAEVERVLERAGVPATRINTIADVFADPHFAARGMLARLPSDELGEVTVAGPVPRLSRTPARLKHAGRAIGQDTRAVLAELCGYSAEELQALEAGGVLRCAPLHE